jgi:flavodoxin
MKTLIIYQSIHHGNTEKVARKIGEVLGADLKKPGEIKPEDLANYDLIGFGSGIYAWNFHRSILKFIDSLPEMSGKKAFIFFTHGSKAPENYASSILKKLEEKHFSFVGQFDCQGWDTFGPLALFGGMGKGLPNEADLAGACKFAEGLALSINK